MLGRKILSNRKLLICRRVGKKACVWQAKRSPVCWSLPNSCFVCRQVSSRTLFFAPSVMFFACLLTFCRLPLWGISEHFTVNQAQMLIEAQPSICHFSRYCHIHAVSKSAILSQLHLERETYSYHNSYSTCP